jgi:hypothetical protein
MTRASRYAVDLGIWGLLTYAVLGLRNIRMGMDESLCGVWGCLPPLEALIAYHGFCLMLAVPPVWLLFQNCSPDKLACAGKALIVLAFTAVAIITGYETITWLRLVPSGYRQFFLQRIMYVMAVHPEIPVIPVLLSGMACLTGSELKRRKTCKREPSGLAMSPD